MKIVIIQIVASVELTLIILFQFLHTAIACFIGVFQNPVSLKISCFSRFSSFFLSK